jgi:hypothetical protein
MLLVCFSADSTRESPGGCTTNPKRTELARLQCFLRNMTFLPASTRNDRRDLILARAEATRIRQLEEARIREAQAMVARFFGLDRKAPTP